MPAGLVIFVKLEFKNSQNLIFRIFTPSCQKYYTEINISHIFQAHMVEAIKLSLVKEEILIVDS